MRAWAYLLGGLLIWAAHFFTLYAIASIFLTSMTARLLAGAATLLALAGAIALAWHGWRHRNAAESMARWSHQLAALTGAAAAIAVTWQGLPVLLI